jgi:hypothetical protein
VEKKRKKENAVIDHSSKVGEQASQISQHSSEWMDGWNE